MSSKVSLCLRSGSKLLTLQNRNKQVSFSVGHLIKEFISYCHANGPYPKPNVKLEFLDDISDGGKYKDVVSDNLIRLYDFNLKQTTELADLIYQKLIADGEKLDLASVDFIKPVNCQLILQLSSVDKGIVKTDKPNTFVCDLTEQSYITAIEFMKAAADSGYNWLCDTSKDDIDFLYSTGGTW